MRELGVGVLVVCGDNGKIQGTISREMVVRRIAAGGDPRTVTVGEVASRRRPALLAPGRARRLRPGPWAPALMVYVARLARSSPRMIWHPCRPGKTWAHMTTVVMYVRSLELCDLGKHDGPYEPGGNFGLAVAWLNFFMAGPANQPLDDAPDLPEASPPTGAVRAKRALRSAPVVLVRGVRMPAYAETGASVIEHGLWMLPVRSGGGCRRSAGRVAAGLLLHFARPRTGSRDDVTSCRRRGCWRQADLVLPDQAENAVRIVWVDGEDVGCPPSGCLRQRRRLTELWPGVLVQRWRVHEKHIDPTSPQFEGHGVPVFDQERYAEQRQGVALTRRRGNRIERSKPKHARDPLLAVPPEVAQAT